MLKLLGRSHSPFLSRPFLLHLTRPLSSTPASPNTPQTLDGFLARLRKRLDHDPDYTLPSIIRHIELTVRTAPQPASVYEAAFDALVWRKRLADGAAVLLRMQKKGLLASNATHATMLAASLATELPDTVTLENVLNNICDIVAHREYTVRDLAALVRVMRVYDVDRGAVAVVVNHFREARGRGYDPPLELVPEFVEAMVREGEVKGAFEMLEKMDGSAPDVPIEAGYHRLLAALRDACEWDAHLVDRVLRGVQTRGIPRQTPMRLLLAWAARREKYLSVLHFYTTLREEADLVCDVPVFRTLFEMHTTFLYNPAQPRFRPLAPRTLFRSMTRLFLSPSPSAPKSDTYLLTTTLTAFLRQRDYAGALTVLHFFLYRHPTTTNNKPTPLSMPTFYTTVKFLVHRAWADLASPRRVRAGQVKWGDLFLGVPFNTARGVVVDPERGEEVVAEMLDRVSRGRFSVRDPLYDPGPVRARGSPRRTKKQKDEERERKAEAIVARYGPVTYYMPSMKEMEDPAADGPPPGGAVFEATPLERLLERALFAEVLMKGELEVGRAEEAVRDLVRKAREEMIGGVGEKTAVEDGVSKRKDGLQEEDRTEKDEMKRKDEENEQDGVEHPLELGEEDVPQVVPQTARTTTISS